MPSRELHAVAELVAQPERLEEVLSRALASLRSVIPYDLAAVMRLEAGELVVMAADGPLASSEVRAHRLPLDAFPTIARSLELRRPIPLEDHSSEEGDPYDGVLDLPLGHHCMVVPLFSAQRSLGIITLDRSSCGVYSQDAVDLAAVYGHLISLAIVFAEQAQQLGRYRQQLREQNRLLEDEAGASQATKRLRNTRSLQMTAVARAAEQVAASDLPVLVLGETGTGKEVVSQAIHQWSARAERPFVKLNCAAIPDSLVESELFGHVRGAFSGAERARLGRFQTAHGGTLLLDEVGDMPLALQSKLLRVLQEGAFEPVGSDTTVRVDVRVIAATHRDLRRAVAAGTFREDLYYRLAVFPLSLPPLRERLDDLDLLAEDVLESLSRSGRGPWTLSQPALARLARHSWPGNIRELANVLERATIMQPEGVLEPRHLLMTHEEPVSVPRERAVLPSFEELQREYFRSVLEQTGGRIYGAGGAAERTGLKPTTLQSRLKRLGLR